MATGVSRARAERRLGWSHGVVAYVVIVGGLLGAYLAHLAAVSRGRAPVASVPPECLARYDHARSPSDTAIIDATVMAKGRAAHMLTCGEYRRAATRFVPQ